MTGGKEFHVPVLAREVLEWLAPVSDGIYVDGTLGLGGHAALILEASAPDGRLVGFEWDEQAAEIAATELGRFGDRFISVPASYARMLDRCRALGVEEVDGILVDLGVSSLQLDSPQRGFSFRSDAPLDMRMDTRLKVTAAQLVNTLKRDELADVLFNYGEERQARRIARFITEARLEEPIRTTRQLAEIVGRAIPAKYHPGKIHVATKVFQALRIAVNREFDNLVSLLNQAPQLLKPGGRLCVISFHSLEDRIVKQSFATNPAYRNLTRKPVGPDQEERSNNPRSRSAKLRVAERVD
jgi:16S rRNA (cytosine1402-N4)-methyltransferase